MTDAEFAHLERLGTRRGRAATVNGKVCRFGLNGVRMSVSPSSLDDVAVGFWREEQIGSSIVRRTWVERNTAEYRAVENAMRAKPTSTVTLGPPPQRSPQVRFTEQVLEAMTSELYWTTREDQRESGGFLFGSADEEGITLSRATGCGKRSTREWARLVLDPRGADGWEIGEDAPTLVGLWLSHPSGDLRPSPQDKEAWIGGAIRVGGSYVGLILADPQSTSWLNPVVRAWVARVDEDGHPHLDAADLKGSPDAESDNAFDSHGNIRS